jgi:hypothetical protein
MRLSKLEKAWFDYPDDPDNARFEIKHLLSGDLNTIQDKISKEAVEFTENDQGTVETRVQLTLRQKMGEELTVCRSIVDWENIFDPEGKPLPCTEKNKKRLCRELPEKEWQAFLKFIADSRKALSEQIEKQQEHARGN